MTDKAHQLLNYWFGNLGSADLPNSDRTNLWFGNNQVVRQQFVEKFTEDFIASAEGRLETWTETPRGRLALIILLDQYPRYFYKQSAKAFSYDKTAQTLCVEGIRDKMDQTLTLIERVFFYMPLVHSEISEHQEQSIHLYQSLVSISMSETTQIYQLFLAYAYAHFRVIKEFGRFPQRNKLLGRESTDAELAFLKNT